LTAAIEVDKDFRKFRKVRSRTFQQTRTATTIVQSNDNLFPSASYWINLGHKDENS
jgi:hypothetical protein